MSKWKQVIVKKHTPILEVIRIIDEGSLQIALVVDENNRLIGVVTDGDVRRGILRGIQLSDGAFTIMNTNFTALPDTASNINIVNIAKTKDLRQIPILNKERQVVDLIILFDIMRKPIRDNWVVLMAGGMGERLRPLTDDCPKPLLKIGDRPVLQTIIDNFVNQGFGNFYVSVNYKANMIENYLGDGTSQGIRIKYLKEQKQLGTAGALSLIQDRIKESIVIMNCDVLTKVNFQQFLDFHQEHHSMATMAVREYHFTVPYGVVKVDQHRLRRVVEKPEQRFFVNAGIYILEPEILQFVTGKEQLDMTSLFEDVITRKYETSVFPLREYWIDIGKIDDYQKAETEYKKVFG